MKKHISGVRPRYTVTAEGYVKDEEAKIVRFYKDENTFESIEDAENRFNMYASLELNRYVILEVTYWKYVGHTSERITNARLAICHGKGVFSKVVELAEADWVIVGEE